MNLIQEAREIVAGKSICTADVTHLRALLTEIDRLSQPRDDKRLARCGKCGNEVLLDEGDSECYYCHAEVAKPCPLSPSDRARFANLMGAASVTFVAAAKCGDIPEDIARAFVNTLGKLREFAGVPKREAVEAATQYMQSQDSKKWLNHMAR